LTIDLGEPITIGSLTVNKATSGDFDTTITGNATNTLTIAGGSATVFNGFSSTGTGVTAVAAPVVFNSTFTVTQGDNDAIQFTQSLSGAGGLNVNRDGNGSGVVVLGAANSYGGATVFTGSGNDDSLVVRLTDADALPAASNLTLIGSAILELAAGDFTREIGTGAGQVQFPGTGGVNRNGFAAFGGDRAVNIGGDLRSVTLSFNNLVLGASTSDSMVDFQNPLVVEAARVIRSYDGSAPIDGRISGSISGAGGINKQNDGVLSFAASNSYSGTTIVQGGVLRLDHIDALSSNSNMEIRGGGVLGLGAADLARDLGAAAGQLQFTTTGGSNGGFSAHGGNRAVVLSGGAGLTWGTGGFVAGSLILGHNSADSTIDLQNPINLGSSTRTVVVQNGSAAVDGKLSGVISGTGGLIKDNPGTLELSGVNTYDGTTTAMFGVLLLTNAQSIPGGITGGNENTIIMNSGNPNNIGVIGLGNGDFTSGLGTGMGTVQFGANGGFAAYGADRAVNLGGAAAQVTWGTGSFVTDTLQLSAVGADAAVDFQNDIDLNGGTRTVRAQNGTANIDGIVSGVVSGTGGVLRKFGGGTLALTGDNSYSGGTLVDEGRLLVNNTAGSGTGSGTVTVNAGTLGGTGTIGGPVVVNSGAHIAPGASIESLDVSSLTLNSGSILDFELGAPGTSDLLNVTLSDGLTINGGTLNLFDAGGLASGTYTLIGYAGSLLGSGVGTFLSQIPNGPAGFNYALDNTGSTIDLIVSSIITNTADFNGDGIIDAADYVLWRKYDGTTGTGTQQTGDANGDTNVDSLDYDIWVATFGDTVPGSGAGGGGAVPEPGATVLLALAAPIFAWRRRGLRRA
jgi:autotransporter-associated beta strand protein